MVERKIGKKLLEIVGSALVAAGVTCAFQKFAKGTDHEPSGTTEEDRSDLFDDLRQMKPNDTGNLLRRHSEATAALQDQRFVRLLCRVQKTPEEGRRPALKYLNDLGDDKFWQMLNVLDNDRLMEWIQRVRTTAGRIAAKDFENLTHLVRGASTQLQTAEKVIDDAVARTAPRHRRFSAWLEAKAGGRKK